MILNRESIEIVYRPWGFFGVFADNVKCTTKILYMEPKQALSLQYHFMRDQLYLCLDDGFIIDYTEDAIIHDATEKEKEEFLSENLVSVPANDGDMFMFLRYHVHRASYVGTKKRGRILDIAFGINDENDIVRLKDKYGRI